jgi:hypothetical protein
MIEGHLKLSLHGARGGGAHDTSRKRDRADAQKARDLDTKIRKGRPLSGTRVSGWRKRMDGSVEKMVSR